MTAHPIRVALGCLLAAAVGYTAAAVAGLAAIHRMLRESDF